MNIKEAMEVIKKFDPSLYEYVMNNGRAFTDLKLIFYAEYLLRSKEA